MSNYLLNEIQNFHKRNIPLVEYPTVCREIRDKINDYTDKKLLYVKQMYINNKIDNQNYHDLVNLIKYEKWKYHKLVN